MKELPFSETADDLEAHGYLEKEYLGNRQVYYRPTKDAEVLVDRTFVLPRVAGRKATRASPIGSACG